MLFSVFLELGGIWDQALVWWNSLLPSTMFSMPLTTRYCGTLVTRLVINFLGAFALVWGWILFTCSKLDNLVWICSLTHIKYSLVGGTRCIPWGRQMGYLGSPSVLRVNMIVLALVTAQPLFQRDLVLLLSVLWVSTKKNSLIEWVTPSFVHNLSFTISLLIFLVVISEVILIMIFNWLTMQRFSCWQCVEIKLTKCYINGQIRRWH